MAGETRTFDLLHHQLAVSFPTVKQELKPFRRTLPFSLGLLHPRPVKRLALCLFPELDLFLFSLFPVSGGL